MVHGGKGRLHPRKDPREQGSKVLTFDDLKRLLRDPKFKFPNLTGADIKDRSKGDALWKIIQCIARGQQGLALTELELVTLASLLNAVTFVIWWHKPLGVKEPVKIYLKTEARNVEFEEFACACEVSVCGHGFDCETYS